MTDASTEKRWGHWGLGLLGLMVCLGQTGCQVSIGGQTLPSPYYQQDDVQYFPAGPEFKLSNEAAAMERFEAQKRLEQQ